MASEAATPAFRGPTAFASKMKQVTQLEPVQRQRQRSSTSILPHVRGHVLRVGDMLVKGKGGSDTKVNKVRIEIDPDEWITDSAQDVIKTREPGEVYMLPTEVHKLGEGDNAPKETVLQYAHNSRVQQLALMSDHFYTHDPTTKRPYEKVERVKPGAYIEFERCSARWGKDKDGRDKLYANAFEFKILRDAPVSQSLCEQFMQLSLSPSSQTRAAFAASVACKGFSSEHENTRKSGAYHADEAHQASVVQTRWERNTSDVLRGFEQLAIDKSEEQKQALAMSSAEIASQPAYAFSTGKGYFWLQDSGRTARLVQHGVAFDHLQRTDDGIWATQPGWIDALYSGDAARTAKLPPVLIGATVRSVKCDGALVYIDLITYTVFDVPAAVKAIAEKGAEADPVLVSEGAAISNQISKKALAPVFGTKEGALVDVGVCELAPVCDAVYVAKPADVGAGSVPILTAQWLGGGRPLFVMTQGLRKCGVLVGKALIQGGGAGEGLCEGGLVCVPDRKVPEEQQLWPPKEDRPRMPTYTVDGYQQLTEEGWKFSEFTSTKFGNDYEFRVVYEGSLGDIVGNTALATDEAAGNAHIETVASMRGDHGITIKQFLGMHALVYVVATKPPDYGNLAY
tara:strand:+ start:447 stop:2321 length:1875 start_codon:yes stop_codon:yes gene_type:complete